MVILLGYIILIILLSLITLICSLLKVNIKNNHSYLISMIIILTLFLCLRGPNVGLDMSNYHEFFITAKNNTFNFLLFNIDFEIGFKLFTKFISFMTSNFRIYIAIISIISMVGIYYYIKNYSNNYFASIFLFITFDYFIYYTCTLRQCIAISILLCSLYFLKKENILCYILSVLLACSFHKTALVFLALPIIKKITFTPKILISYIGTCLALFIIKKPMLEIITKLIYNRYIDYQDTSGTGYMMLLLIFSIILFICFFNKKFDINKKENKTFVGMLLLALPFQILSTTQGLVARIVLYFTYSLIVLIPNNIEVMDNKYKRILYSLFYISLFLFYTYQIFTDSIYVHYTIF